MLKIICYEVHHYEVKFIASNKVIMFSTEEDMLDYMNQRPNERLIASKVLHPIFRETEDNNHD